MNYQIYRLKRKVQRWLYSIEDFIYFLTRKLFDCSPMLQRWIADRDKKKAHKRKIKRITEDLFQAVEVYRAEIIRFLFVWIFRQLDVHERLGIIRRSPKFRDRLYINHGYRANIQNIVKMVEVVWKFWIVWQLDV